MPDIDGSREGVPVKFRFQRPEGPSVDDEGNVYFNTYGCKDFNFRVSCGVWKLEKGQNAAFLAVNSFEETDPLDPYGDPFDPNEDIGLIREGKGTAFLTNGPFTGKLLIAAESLSSGLFEGIYMADAKSAALRSPVLPNEFINRNSSRAPEIFDVAVDSKGSIYLSTAGNDNAITKYDSSGNLIGVFKALSSEPRFMAFDMDDNLYMTTTIESGLYNVFKLNREGEVEEFWFVPNAYGVAVE